MTQTELKAWLHGIKWIRNNFGGHNSPEEVMNRRESFRNMRREAQVDEGNFLYYIVEEATNIRRANNGVPIIYSSVDIADDACNWAHEVVISVAAYNLLYGRFMVTDDDWKRTY